MKTVISRSQGFSLVELMVALLIGLVIMLGAGQLFLNGFQSFHQTSNLGDKQAALVSAADVLIRDVRRADGADSIEGTNAGESGELKITLADGSVRIYYLDKPNYEDREVWSLYLDEDEEGGGTEAVAEGFNGVDAFSAVEDGSVVGLYVITFDLVSEGSNIVFHAMNRTAAAANH